MTGHSRMIFFIVMMFVATGSVVVFYETADTASGNISLQEPEYSSSLTDPRITHVSVTDTYQSEAERVEIEIRGGSQPVSIEDMSVRVRTPRSDSRFQTQLK